MQNETANTTETTSATNLMVWHDARSDGIGAYVGITKDGREVHVDGDEISESKDFAAKADGVDLDALFEADRDAYNAAYDKYLEMQLNPEDWAGLDADGNANVRTFCALCGHESANEYSDDMGDQLTRDSYYDEEDGQWHGHQWREQRYCDCECHEDGIARGKAADTADSNAR